MVIPALFLKLEDKVPQIRILELVEIFLLSHSIRNSFILVSAMSVVALVIFICSCADLSSGFTVSLPDQLNQLGNVVLKPQFRKLANDFLPRTYGNCNEDLF